MKGNYRHNSANVSRIKRLLLLCVFLVIIVVIFRPLLSSVVSGGGVAVQKTSFWLFESTGSIPAFFRDRDTLIQEISELKSQLSASGGNDLTIKNLLQENIHLRSLVGEQTVPLIAADVIARPPQVAFDALLINKGREQGVVENAVVYLHGDKAIGVIVRVFDDAAVVKLITSPDTESSVYVVGPNVYANARGLGGGVLQVAVPQGVVLDTGNLVIVPTLGGGVYGEIEEVVSVPSEPVQFGLLTTSVATQAIRTVTVGAAPVSEMDFDAIDTAVNDALLDMLQVDIPESALVSTTSTTTRAVFATTTPAEIE
jgi:cell shape-determining protein MreC